MNTGLENRLTTMQIEKLRKIGVQNLYDLITIFPYKLELLSPYTAIKQNSNQKYIVNGFVHRFEIIVRGRKFIKVDIAGEHQIQVYMFNTAPYILSLLKQKIEFQFIIENKNGFWTIEKFAPKRTLNKETFILGQAGKSTYIVPKYIKNMSVTDTTFKAIHNRLAPADYQLNLHGLIPENNQFIPQVINLFHIHHPVSIEQFHETQRQFTSMNVFLRVALLRKVNIASHQKIGVATKLDIEYLKNITQQLPYTLSMTQKTAIWDILNDLSI